MADRKFNNADMGMIATPKRLPVGDAIALHCQSVGSGRPVLLLHGLFGSGNNLGGLARHLAGSYQTLRLDLRNHGRSPHSSAMNYPLMVADVLRFLDQRGIDQCAVIGHSMGGKVAMGLALLRPERVAALLVVDICPINYEDSRHDGVFDAMLGLPLDKLESRVEADRILGNSIDDAGIRQFLLTNLYRDQRGYAWRVNLDALLNNRRQLAVAPAHGGAYVGPTLLVKGARSDYISSRCNQAIASQLPQVELKIIADAGHWPHAEKPVIFNALVSRFLHKHYRPEQRA